MSTIPTVLHQALNGINACAELTSAESAAIRSQLRGDAELQTILASTPAADLAATIRASLQPVTAGGAGGQSCCEVASLERPMLVIGAA
jgi:hypothetical protein